MRSGGRVALKAEAPPRHPFRIAFGAEAHGSKPSGSADVGQRANTTLLPPRFRLPFRTGRATQDAECKAQWIKELALNRVLILAASCPFPYKPRLCKHMHNKAATSCNALGSKEAKGLENRNAPTGSFNKLFGAKAFRPVCFRICLPHLIVTYTSPCFLNRRQEISSFPHAGYFLPARSGVPASSAVHENPKSCLIKTPSSQKENT